LEADYSVCLQLLLKYPQPEKLHGPHTFVDDALYLKGHLNADGGATLITKYTDRTPNILKSPGGTTRPTTPSFSRFNSFRQRGLGGRSPLNNPSKYLPQQAGVEAIIQGAAKGAKEVLERGEKLGINQAVRDAVGEIKRNVSNFNEARHVSQSPRAIMSQDSAQQAFTALERRNKHLASMLDETVDSLKSLSGTSLEDKTKSLELIEIAAAKIQFVKIYLEDSSMDLPTNDPSPKTGSASMEKEGSVAHSSDSAAKDPSTEEKTSSEEAKISSLNLSDPTGPPAKDSEPPQLGSPTLIANGEATKARVIKPTPAPKARPSAPIPTRSTLAQSSFSWMLEPDQSSPPSKPSPAKITKSPPAQHKKRASNNASRERNAFLFGDPTTEQEGRRDSEEIFGLEPLGKGKKA
jgi:TBC1 domain family protein 5